MEVRYGARMSSERSSPRAPDPRSARTIAALRQGLNNALIHREIDGLSVVDICRAAGVKRSSFYTHFTSVADLVISTALIDLSEWLAPSDPQLDRDAFENELADTLLGALDKMRPHRVLFGKIFRASSASALRAELVAAVSSKVMEIIDGWRRRGAHIDIDQEIVVAYSAHGVVGVLEFWSVAEQEPSPARIAQALTQTIPAWWPRDNSER